MRIALLAAWISPLSLRVQGCLFEGTVAPSETAMLHTYTQHSFSLRLTL